MNPYHQEIESVNIDLIFKNDKIIDSNESRIIYYARYMRLIDDRIVKNIISSANTSRLRVTQQKKKRSMCSTFESEFNINFSYNRDLLNNLNIAIMKHNLKLLKFLHSCNI